MMGTEASAYYALKRKHNRRGQDNCESCGNLLYKWYPLRYGWAVDFPTPTTVLGETREVCDYVEDLSLLVNRLLDEHSC